MGVRVGVVGPGAIAERHAAALLAAGAELVAVAGPEREQTTAFARGFGVPAAYGTAEELYAHPGLDAVVIASPHAHHARQTLTALEAGLHVLCEIPIALSLPEAQAVAEAARAAGRHVAVAHTLRHCLPYLRVREEVERGALHVRHIVARTLMLRQDDTGMGGRPRGWTDDVLWHHGAHTVDAALWFLGATGAEVRGMRGESWARSGRPMDGGAVLRTPDGGLATIALSYHARLPSRDMTIIAEDRTLHLSGGVLREHDGTVLVDCGDQMEDDGLARQDADFVAAITGGRPPGCAVADILPAMRVLHEWGAQ
ncbi:Gfo/Idh/MocA family protein [Nonomuraea typhae]|uniref:Gfo/Idh/MocA family protein n=1 Tax=Nonomuraea typhae TaxID=2603600 RepID=UPI00248343FE|nr:Gfo/Idh/MocA family oxidoreductase [Nonomuraea typhae]